MKRLYILTVCSIVCCICIFSFKNRNKTTITFGEGCVIEKEWFVENKNNKTPKIDVRPADQTFLTFPEWYLVFSPEEQADYFKNRTATTFPFISHTAQIWESYDVVNNQIKGKYPTNFGYHFMIWVIGTSASVEYTIKAFYETIIGRITDTGYSVTEEDKLNAKFTSDYVRFIKDRPWYEFNFKSILKDLWSETPILGQHVFRKLERRYILTSELIVKFIYAKLIGLGTSQVYEAALPTTTVLLENDSLIKLPRYNRFGEAALNLAKSGHTFTEIAGNKSSILVSIIVPLKTNPKLKDTRTIFIQPISSNPKLKRITFATPVAYLSSVLQKVDNQNIHLEHVFDY